MRRMIGDGILGNGAICRELVEINRLGEGYQGWNGGRFRVMGKVRER